MAGRLPAPKPWLLATMAIMSPDDGPLKATAGEKRTFGLLCDGLPDHFAAWSDPAVAGRYPYLGLLMREFKGWRVDQIAWANDHEVEIHRAEGDQVRVEVVLPIRHAPSSGSGAGSPEPSSVLSESKPAVASLMIRGSEISVPITNACS